jgi:protein-S-isoprenylcysteine O-methyltransferase Ste14
VEAYPCADLRLLRGANILGRMYDYFIGVAGVFPDLPAAIAFTAAQFGFMATESRRGRFAPQDAVRVKPPFPNVLFAIIAGLATRLLFGFLKIGVIGGPRREAWVLLGFVLIVLGWLCRIWAQRALGGYFTGEVAVQRDHRVIDSGPYHWVRHPSYTGGVLAAIGFGLALSTWLGALISGVLLIWAYVLRVPREEALLAGQLGEAYTRYCARTKRFVPYVF